MVLFRDALPAKNIVMENKLKGDFSRLSLEWGSSKILIKCCYAPNDDCPAIDSENENNSSRFFREVFDDSNDDGYDVIMMAGDFNVAPDPNKDTLGYLHVNNPNSRNFIERMKALCMLTDVFRHKNPDVRRYTFSKGQAKNHTKARLDYFLLNEGALESVVKVGIGRENALSDHCPIFIHLRLTKVVRGRGFWRLNNEFLKEPEYVFGLNNKIEGVIKQYSSCTTNCNPPSQEQALPPFLISCSLLHDVLLLESRSYTLKYAANQKRKLLKKTEELNKKIDEKAESVEPDDIEMVNFWKLEVQNIEDERNMVAARRRYEKMQLEGEKPTRYFCSMNKRFQEKAQFEEIILEEVDENGKETTRVVRDQEEIEKEVRTFYCKLYSEGEVQINRDEIIKSIETVTKIDKEDVKRLELEITEGEVSSTLKVTKNNVAPGPGGFGGAFYKMFWKYLKYIVVGAIREVYENKELPLSQRLGIIALIPKADKDKRYIKNWRPLTLLETFYKLISATLANRIKPVLDTIVGRHQKAYIPGRYIAECTRNTYDLFTYAKVNNAPGMLLMIDFEKAFDSVDFRFLVTSLELFGFGEHFITWIRIILGCNEGTQFNAVTVVNGNISKPFEIRRGCRQGDPIFIHFSDGSPRITTKKHSPGKAL